MHARVSCNSFEYIWKKKNIYITTTTNHSKKKKHTNSIHSEIFTYLPFSWFIKVKVQRIKCCLNKQRWFVDTVPHGRRNYIQPHHVNCRYVHPLADILLHRNRSRSSSSVIIPNMFDIFCFYAKIKHGIPPIKIWFYRKWINWCQKSILTKKFFFSLRNLNENLICILPEMFMIFPFTISVW